MKTFMSLLLLAGATALATPAHAQQPTARPTAEPGVKSTTNHPVGTAQAARTPAADTKLTWQQRRAIKKKKLTPYAEAMLHNELLREEPKPTGNGLL
ncbi:hypothetical protein [Hymenobacter psychrophilus]|uniref:Uncharacterized protein n=1 Tax=Hymenobacter psychrophilus TaxID=651662 RepID=A0A1H3JG72_9BACT|nr:hypothetical protein [Hymenobacter psychrophilus]SDY38569.1 hypothetical protein SAMN04488069_10851 [Hymenobacter psychrophilus]